jgi:hypothetical protein
MLMETIRGVQETAAGLVGRQVQSDVDLSDVDLDHYQVLVAMMRSHR